MFLVLALFACKPEPLTSAPPVDADEDGYSVEEDCNDNNAAIHPGVEDGCDRVDNDCDGVVDEDAAVQTYYLDWDSDGFINPDLEISACEQPFGYTIGEVDCDDHNSNRGAEEHDLCDGIDNDCDGLVDEGSVITVVHTQAVPVPESYKGPVGCANCGVNAAMFRKIDDEITVVFTIGLINEPLLGSGFANLFEQVWEFDGQGFVMGEAELLADGPVTDFSVTLGFDNRWTLWGSEGQENYAGEYDTHAVAKMQSPDIAGSSDRTTDWGMKGDSIWTGSRMLFAGTTDPVEVVGVSFVGGRAREDLQVSGVRTLDWVRTPFGNLLVGKDADSPDVFLWNFSDTGSVSGTSLISLPSNSLDLGLVRDGEFLHLLSTPGGSVNGEASAEGLWLTRVHAADGDIHVTNRIAAGNYFSSSLIEMFSLPESTLVLVNSWQNETEDYSLSLAQLADDGTFEMLYSFGAEAVHADLLFAEPGTLWLSQDGEVSQLSCTIPQGGQ